MTPNIHEQQRPEPPERAGEWETLRGFLDFHRATFAKKIRGLDRGQLRQRLPGHPSTMTLAGMANHLAFVEDYWFNLNIARESPIEPYLSIDWDADPDGDWDVSEPDETILARWQERVRRAEGILDALREEHGDTALDVQFTRWGREKRITVRWLLVHMVEEYARHNGHADLIRESIDGQTGE